MAASNLEITKDMFAPAENASESAEKIGGEAASFWSDAFHRLLRNKAAIVSSIVIILLILMAIFGPILSHYTIDDQDLSRANVPPKVQMLSWLHPFDGKENGVDVYQSHNIHGYYWFGTDGLGRDLWTRTWSGTRISLIIALVAALVDLLIGVIYGGISGYFGGKIDNIMQRTVEIIYSIPYLVWTILLILILKPGLITITIAIFAINWVPMSRIVRGQMIRLKNDEYVLASRTLGASHSRIIFKHLIPNSLGQIIVNTMFSIPNAIFFEAFLSFIGLGITDPMASLGSLINKGYSVLQIHPYQTLFPGIVICLLLVCFNILGDGLRDAFDPKLRH